MYQLNSMSSSPSFCSCYIWSSILFVMVAYLVYTLKIKIRSSLPPGPKGLPILGNLLMLGGKLLHRDLHFLSMQHGPIMYLRLGFVPTIVVSSPEAAELFLKTHDLVCAGRPVTEAGKYFSYERRGLAFTEYGPYLKIVRKLCNVELLSNLKIESFRSMRTEEMKMFIESLKEASRHSVAVNLSNKVKALSTDMSFRMIFGNKYIYGDDEREFHDVVEEVDHLASLFNIADYFPYVGALDLQGLAKRMKALSSVYDAMLEKVIDQHLNLEAQDSSTPDFVHILLSCMKFKRDDFQIDRSNIKAILLDLLAGSVDTSATAIEWTFSELLKDPRLMKNVQQEIDSVVGLDRMVQESDLVNFHYLDMVIKESFRLHPVVPLLIPHESTIDCTINGYTIPRKSQIIINTWAIGRDPNAWDDAEKFQPERFLGKNIDYKGLDFQFLPFGSGRRGCPGIHLGLTVVRLVVAQLVHCFDWELPNGMIRTEINMDEDFGNTMRRAHPLSAIPIFRLRD